MALTVYAPPEELEPPEFQPWDTYGDRIKAYSEQLKAWIMENGSSEYRGKQARFGVGDGYAAYYVFSLSPLELIHDPAYDGYHYPHIERLTRKDITDQIDREDAWRAMVMKQQQEQQAQKG